MPTFDFTAPDGKNYSVDGPEGATPQQAFQILQQHLGSSPQIGVGEDAAKSVGSGLASGTIGTLGAAGDIRELASRGVDALGSKFGVDLSPVKTVASHIPGLNVINAAPTSEDIKSTVTNPIVSPDYEPKSEFNRILKKSAEFGPTALLGGPEGLGARVLTNAVAPAIGSEIGRSVAGPYGEIAGALAGGVGGTAAARKFQEMAAARQAAKAVPTAEELLKTAGDQFNQARDMNLVVKPDFASKAATEMRDAIKGFDPEAHKPLFSAADRLDNLAQSSSVPMNDVENIRKQLVSLKTSPDASVREGARKAISSLQDSQKAITSADVISGDAPAYSKLISDATGNWAAGERSNTVMGKANLAELNADTAGTGANVDNAYRQAIKQLVRPVNNDIVPKAQRLGFNKAEIDALNTAARGTTGGNIARYIGKGAPTGLVSAAGGLGVGHMAGGPLGAVAVPAVGYIAKKIGDLSTKRAVSAVDSLVRSRSPLAAQVTAQLPPQIVAQLPAKSQRILQALIASEKLIAQQGQAVGQTQPQ